MAVSSCAGHPLGLADPPGQRLQATHLFELGGAAPRQPRSVGRDRTVAGVHKAGVLVVPAKVGQRVLVVPRRNVEAQPDVKIVSSAHLAARGPQRPCAAAEGSPPPTVTEHGGIMGCRGPVEWTHCRQPTAGAGACCSRRCPAAN